MITRRAYREAGHTNFAFGAAIQGKLSEQAAESLSRDLVPITSMVEGFGNATFRYVEDNEGFTHIRNLVDAFIVVDSWFPAYDHVFVFVHAYFQFDPKQIVERIEQRGLCVVDHYFNRLKI